MRRRILYLYKKFHRGCAKFTDKQILICFLSVGFIIRLVYSLVGFYQHGTESFSDSWDYVYYAESILEQGIFPLRLHPWSQEVGPGYPLIIATSFFLFGKTYWPLVIFNAIASTLVTYVVYSIGRTVYGKEVAVISAFWSVFYVQFFKFTPFILKESIVILLFPICIYFVLKLMVGKSSRWDVFWLVVFYAGLIHIDERYFFYFPFLAAAILFLGSGSLSARLAAGSAFTIGVLILIIPWSYRNYLYYDRVVVLTERTTKFTDRLFGYAPLKRKVDLMPYDPANHSLYEAIADSLKAGHIVKIKNVKFIPDIDRAIKEGIDVRTFSPRKHYWEEFKELWRPAKFSSSMVAYGYRYQGPWANLSNFVFLLSYGVLLPLVVLEICFGLIRKNRAVLFMASILFIHTIIHVFLAHARERYRMPIDPLIIVMALAMVYYISKQWLVNNYLMDSSKK